MPSHEVVLLRGARPRKRDNEQDALRQLIRRNPKPGECCSHCVEPDVDVQRVSHPLPGDFHLAEKAVSSVARPNASSPSNPAQVDGVPIAHWAQSARFKEFP